jgi:hypothetical protein
MEKPVPAFTSNHSLEILSRLLFTRCEDVAEMAQLKTDVLRLDIQQFNDLVELATVNHVIVRALVPLRDLALKAGDPVRASWADAALAPEYVRIERAVSFVHLLCHESNQRRMAFAVIKSLDHWPDLGSDLDLYTDAASEEVIQFMYERFGATIAQRSWGDRLARKWNFAVPELPELIEIHVGRLGQTGEQSEICSSLMRRTRSIRINGLAFRVPSPADRLLISTLQRMYRHFYFRLCDIADTTLLLESGGLDFADLYSAATSAGIREGVATYLAIVADYVKRYRSAPLDLPQWVVADAHFGGNKAYFARDFLRIPIMPQSALLYGSQMAEILRRGQLNRGARLGLLPLLATAALMGQKITGSDKGIW